MKILKNYDISYMDIIKTLKAKMVTHKQLAMKEVDPDKERLYTIRHDVDYNIKKAVNLARYEKSQNLKSTYFLLHTADYFDYSKNFKNSCKIISDCGHDIGIHNNAIAQHIRTGKPHFDILMKPIDFLRSCDIEVLGSAPHGDKAMCRKFNFMNYELWDIHKLSDFGLIYHTWMFYREAFIGDGGCVLKGWCWPPKTTKTTKYRNFQQLKNQIIKKFNRLDHGLINLLFHPRWWV